MTTVVLVLLAGAGAFAATAVARTAGGHPSGHTVCTDERSDSGRFEVVLGLTKIRSEAVKLQGRARKAGFGVRIERDSCTQYEVAVGRYPTRAAAGKILARLKLAGFRSARIEADPKVSTTKTSPEPTTTTATGTGTATTGTTTQGGGGGGGGTTTHSTTGG
jgi:hypothetical protein